jgi:predicted alpha/beta-fold hydrolase
MHGLTGGSHESYVRDMAELAFNQCRMRVVRVCRPVVQLEWGSWEA